MTHYWKFLVNTLVHNLLKKLLFVSNLLLYSVIISVIFLT